MAQGRLILTVGLPRSGKSTWARATGFPVVNPDGIRLALHGQRFFGPAEPFVWSIAYLMVEALFRAGHLTVIVDATNTTEKRRKEWTDRFGDAVELKVFTTAADECKRRAIATGQEDLLPVIDRMAEAWDLPVPDVLDTEDSVLHPEVPEWLARIEAEGRRPTAREVRDG